MKKAIVFLIALSLHYAAGAQSRLLDALRAASDSQTKKLDCENSFISSKTFPLIASKFLTRVVNNPAIMNQPATYASLKLSEKDTRADLQVSFPVTGFSMVTMGFNAVVSENIANLYSGEDGVLPNWGLKAGWSYAFKNTIFYDGDQCEELRAERENLMAGLVDANQATWQKDYRQLLRRYRDLMQYRRSAGLNATGVAETAREMQLLWTGITQLRRFYGRDSVTINQDSVDNWVADQISQLEVNKANALGFRSWAVNLNAFYNRKGFTQFFPTLPSVNDRFVDTAYNNWGFSAGVSMNQFGRHFINVSVSLGWQNRSTLELEENQKYNRSFTTEVAMPSGTGVTQYRTSTKTAFDSSAVQFKKFGAAHFNLQSTVLFGKERSFGFNAFALTSFSSYYSVHTRLDLGLGPVLSLVNKESKESRLNFSLYGAFRNVLDKDTKGWDKFVINFNVQVPLSL